MNEKLDIDVKTLKPFTKFIYTIGELPTSYLMSMTYEEQLVWLCNYLTQTIIPTINNNAEAVKEVQDLVLQLQEYINNYFDNLDVQEEINNKLDEMVEDGTLAELLNETIFSELNEKVDNIQSEVKENAKNSKYMLYIFCDNEYRQSIPYVTELLTRSANAGFKESQMTIHINDDGTLVEDKTKFTAYNEIATNLNIPITSLKVHGNYSAINYQNTILDVLQYFPNVNSVFVFNEQASDVYNHGLSYPSVIKNNYPNVKKVGFTIAYNQAFYGNNITNEQWISISNVFDLIGVHMYPSCSGFSDSANCSYDKVLNAFNQPTFILPWTKEIWLTESGVLPYWQMMELPENYNISTLTDTTRTTAPQYLFYRALANCNFAQRCTKIIPWYIESGMSDEKHELFDILNNIITNR